MESYALGAKSVTCLEFGDENSMRCSVVIFMLSL